MVCCELWGFGKYEAIVQRDVLVLRIVLFFCSSLPWHLDVGTVVVTQI